MLSSTQLEVEESEGLALDKERKEEQKKSKEENL